MNLDIRQLLPGDFESLCRAVTACNEPDEPVHFAFDFDPAEPFEDYLARLARWQRGEDLPERFVPNSYYVALVDGEVAGRVSLRHELNDFLRTIGGHIGYIVVPRFRRQGIATELLRFALRNCPRLGIEHAVLTCDQGNEASRKIIEGCGGVFEALVTEGVEVPKRRYLVPTQAASAASGSD